MKRELTVAEAAVVTGRSAATLYRWIRAGRLAAVESSGGLLLRTDAVLAAAAGVRRGRPRT